MAKKRKPQGLPPRRTLTERVSQTTLPDLKKKAPESSELERMKTKASIGMEKLKAKAAKGNQKDPFIMQAEARAEARKWSDISKKKKEAMHKLNTMRYEAAKQVAGQLRGKRDKAPAVAGKPDYSKLSPVVDTAGKKRRKK